MADPSDRIFDELTGCIVVLAGPGVVDAGALDALRDLASAGGLGVANTWGAKGAFAWDSPHHLGTCGLQAHDFELLGFATADVIVTTGLDADEAPADRVALAPVVDVAPLDLIALVGRVRATATPPNDLYPRLAAVAQPGYRDPKVPLHPARAVADLGAVLPPEGLVVAEPGVAGLWVARTFPTPALTPGRPRRVLVPARRLDAGPIGIALAAARAGRPAVYVTAGEPDPATRAAIEAAERDAVALTVVVWRTAGRLSDADEHATVLSEALATQRCARLDIPVALADTQLLLDAAGPVVAWDGLTPAEMVQAGLAGTSDAGTEATRAEQE